MSDQKLYMSPIVECQHAHVKQPDTKFSKTGIYQIDLVMERNNPEHRAFVQELSALRPEGAKNPVCKVESKDAPTGIVKCKQNAVVQGAGGKTYEGFQPVVFDAQGNKLNTIPLMGNGTKVRVQVEPRPYTLQGGGVRLRPVAIQIVDLVPYEADADTPANPSAVGGFGAVEGGSFVADEKPQAEPGFDAVPGNEPPAYDDIPPQFDGGMDDGFGEPAGAQAGQDYEDF